MKGALVGLGMVVAGVFESPAFNGLDMAGWFVLLGSGMVVAHRWAARA